MINSFLQQNTIITSFLHNFDAIFLSYDKINFEGKKIIENFVNNSYELSILEKDFQTNKNLNLFRNINMFHEFSIKTEIQNFFNEIIEIVNQISMILDKFEKNYENLTIIIKKIFKTDQKSLFDEELYDSRSKEYSKKIFSMIKLYYLTNKLKRDYKKDLNLKKEIIIKLENLFNTAAINEEKIKKYKYLLQLWIYKPNIDEKNLENWKKELIYFIKK